MAEKKKHLIEITYSETKDKEVITLNTDDLAWSMNQYQRNRQPFTWELLDVKSNDVCCGLPDVCSSCD
jgi:hypothetical protein